MTTLLFLLLMLGGALLSLVVVPLVLVGLVLRLAIGLVVIPFKILGTLVGGLARGAFKGMFLLALFMIPLALIALPFTILAFGAWLLYRILRPRRAPQACVVA